MGNKLKIEIKIGYLKLNDMVKKKKKEIINMRMKVIIIIVVIVIKTFSI